MWSNFCCNRNYNRNFQLCLFLIFASSFINRYPLYSVLLRKSNILQLQMLNYHLGQAQKIIKTSKINITENFCYNFCYTRNWTRRIGLITKASLGFFHSEIADCCSHNSTSLHSKKLLFLLYTFF